MNSVILVAAALLFVERFEPPRLPPIGPPQIEGINVESAVKQMNIQQQQGAIRLLKERLADLEASEVHKAPEADAVRLQVQVLLREVIRKREIKLRQDLLEYNCR